MDNATYPYVAFAGVQSQWALEDDEIEIGGYDDDAEYDLAGIPATGIVFMTVCLSAFFGVLIFYCSYRQERAGLCCCPKNEEDEPSDFEEEEESAKLRRTSRAIESRLKLKKWETRRETFDDELTRNNSLSDDDDMCSVVSDVSSNMSNGSAASQNSILMQDPAFVRLQQKPRCVLCSKFFTESDTVTESWEPTCQHNFHKECIVGWLKKNDGCPVCKKAYVVGIGVPAEP